MFDLVVIGSGPGGYIAAIKASQLGMKVALLEKRSHLGGTCLNVGCIPSKALLDSSHHYVFSLSDLKTHGVDVNHVELNLLQMMTRKDKVVKNLTQGIKYLMKKNKVTCYEGKGYLKSPHKVEVCGLKNTILETKNILLATGSVPAELPFLPFDKKTVLSSTEALKLKQVPKKMIIIGAGIIGLELGSVWNRLGSEIHLLDISKNICSGMDSQMTMELKKSLENQGLNFHLQAHIHKEIKRSAHNITLTYTDCSGEKHISAPLVLVAIGRKPYSKGLGLEDLKLPTDEKGRVIVNSHFQTSYENIYAIGDLIKGPMLAHKAEEEGVAVAEILIGQAGEVNYNTLPSVVYTYPELASVGKIEEELEKGKYKKGIFPFKANGRAQASGDTEGFVKVLSCKKTDRILGVHILGPKASDLLQEAVLAMEFQASSEDLARSFHSHPTFTEALKEASLECYNKIARQI